MHVQQLARQWSRRLAVGATMLVLSACGAGGGAGSSGQPTSPSSGSSGGASGDGSSGIGPLATSSYTISWDTVSDPSVTGYRIYFDYSPLGSGRTPTYVDASGTNATLRPGDYGIKVGDTLYVAVASRGTSGSQSPVSSQISIVVE